MKRVPSTHGGVFDDEDFAEKYTSQHRKMAERFGRGYSDKLSSRGFQKGRILDVGVDLGEQP